MQSSPIVSLRREHANMRSVLMLIGDLLTLIDECRAPDFVLLANALYYMRRFPSLVHHPKEDAIFERVAALDPASNGEVEKVRAQHLEIYQLEDWLIESALDAPKPGTEKRARLVEFGKHYLELQRSHSENEERLLFPRAVELLSAKDWVGIERFFKKIDDPVFGNHTGERYELLYDHLMREAVNQ